MNKEKNFISAVIYIHNAENRIHDFVSAVMTCLEENFEHSEIICVNDGCTDGSVEELKKVSQSAALTSVTILHLSYYHGLETAMNAGVDLAIGDFVFEFDSTILDFDPVKIMEVYRRALQGYDVVSASPDKRQKLSSSLFYYLFDKYTILKYKMGTERFRILSRRMINRISSMNKMIPYRKAVYANSGLKADMIKYQVRKDRAAKGNKDRQEKEYRHIIAVDSLIMFTEIGYKFSITMTMLMIFATLFMILYTVIVYLIGTPVEGWTTTILFLSVCFFGLFGILTVIIKYLQIIVNLIFKRKRYHFEGIEKLTK